MPSSENFYIKPVFIEVQEGHDHIEALYPTSDTSPRAHFERSKANLHRAVYGLIFPPKVEPIEIPAENEAKRE